ncbi:MAG: TolC family protein [Acidobacteriota bacterium]
MIVLISRLFRAASAGPRTWCILLAAAALLPHLLPDAALAQAAPTADQEPALTISLQNALERARDNSQELQSAGLDVASAREDRRQAKAALLPSLGYFNQYIYTQGNGTDSGVFVSNDGVHVYNSLAEVHEELFSPQRLAEYRRTAASQALAAAKRDVVERGLTATVARDYFAAVAARRRVENARGAVEEAQRFLTITQQLENGGEVAHADVLKAQLVAEQSQRDVLEAQLTAERAQIALAVLMFPDFRLGFNLVDDLASVPPLPAYAEIERAALETSPELQAAKAALRQEEYSVSAARSGYLPSLSLDYFFGINANQFAVHDFEGRNRLGSSVQATLNIPVFDWGSTRSKVSQADIRRQQAELALALTRKQLLSNLHGLYAEAQSVGNQLDLLRNSADAAAESLRLTRLRYQAGEASVLEVVDAQTTLYQSRNAYDDGLARYRTALSNIQALIGTL